MADVLIKGLALPKEPKLLILGIDEYGNVCRVSCEHLNFEGLYNAKAIELSEHTRLVNKDEVLECISKRRDFAEKVNDEICADLCDLLTEDINGLVEASNADN